MFKVTQQARGRDRVQSKPNWLKSSGSPVLCQPQDGVRPWSPTGHVTFSKLLHSSALPHPGIPVELSGVPGLVGGGGWARIFGRAAVQTRPLGQGRGGEVTGSRAHRVPLWPWGRLPPLCLTGDARLGKAWSTATVQGRPWPTFLEGGRGPGIQATLMPKLSLVPTHTSCQGLGAGARTRPVGGDWLSWADLNLDRIGWCKRGWTPLLGSRSLSGVLGSGLPTGHLDTGLCTLPPASPRWSPWARPPP